MLVLSKNTLTVIRQNNDGCVKKASIFGENEHSIIGCVLLFYNNNYIAISLMVVRD